MSVALGEAQNLLYRLISSPNGVTEGLATEHLASGGLGAIIRGDSRLSPVERVGIYADMYFYRLLDVVKEDFPATFAILGDLNLHNLITGYLVANPPSRPSISDASRHLAAFVAGSDWIGRFPYLSDLIRLERALVEVFLGPDAIPLSLQKLRLTPPSDWPSLRFGLHPAAQLLDCDWKVDELLRAAEQVAASPVVRESNTIIVWRNESVRYRALEEIERRVLRAVCGGETFMLACETIVADREDINSEKLTAMLLRWVADGFLLRIQ